jgi:hypothetical protein
MSEAESENRSRMGEEAGESGEGVGRLLEEIVEGGDSSHVDPTTIMVRRCGEGWAASSRRSWREETPPMWTQPPSW